MMRANGWTGVFFPVLVLILTACGTSPKVTRIDPNEVTDLSGAWE